MNERVKTFIEDNIELIEDTKWEEIYRKAKNYLIDDTGQFTSCLLDADIHPENYLKELPDYFLCGSIIKEFTIPSNITSIGNDAFGDCSKLINVIIPDSVKSIGEFAFEDCSSLTSITIPSSVTRIGDYTLRGCTSLASITIPDSITSISQYMFAGCTNLKNVTLGNNITYIGYAAFFDCSDDLIINYNGSRKDWETLYDKRAFQSTYFTVNCTDGKIVKKKGR